MPAKHTSAAHSVTPWQHLSLTRALPNAERLAIPAWQHYTEPVSLVVSCGDEAISELASPGVVAEPVRASSIGGATGISTATGITTW